MSILLEPFIEYGDLLLSLWYSSSVLEQLPANIEGLLSIVLVIVFWRKVNFVKHCPIQMLQDTSILCFFFLSLDWLFFTYLLRFFVIIVEILFNYFRFKLPWVLGNYSSRYEVEEHICLVEIVLCIVIFYLICSVSKWYFSHLACYR